MSSTDDKPQSSSLPQLSEPEQKSNRDSDDDQSSEEPKKDEEEEATVSNRESEKQILEDTSDGFRTPTSSDHRIQPITQCPPAPKKPRPQPSGLKRKESSPPPGAARRLHFDASTAEVESIFRPIDDQDDSTQDHKSKKARTDDKDKS